MVQVEKNVHTGFFGKHISKPFSYFIFILWAVITIAPLVWMAYSSFKTNEELSMDIYAFPHDMFDNKNDGFVVVHPQLNIMYPKKLTKKYNFTPREYDVINEKIIILESLTIAPGKRSKVHFLDRSEMPDNLKNLGKDDIVILNELPRKYQTQISWATVFWNYTSAWNRGGLAPKFLNSLLYTGVSTFFVVLFGLMIGFAVTKFKYVKIGLIVSGLIGLGYLLDINQVIIPLFLMLTNIKLTDTHMGIILVYTAFGLPMAVMLSSQFIRGLPNSLIESAYIDGASPLRTFLSIIVPMTTPVIVTIAIMSSLGVWNEFLLVLVMASKEATKSLPVGVFSFSSRTGVQLGWQIAALVIATLPVLFVYFVFQKNLSEGVAGGALKE